MASYSNPLMNNVNIGAGAGSMQPTSSTASVGGSNSGSFFSGIGDSLSSFFSGGLTADSLKFDPTKNAYIGPNNIAYGLNGQKIGGSSFSAGDFANAFFGFLASAAQNKIAKQQLALGKEQLASSKASYATDALTQAEQYNREWTNRMKSLQGDPEIYKQSLSAFYDNPNDVNRLANTYTQNVADWKSKESMDLLNTQGTDLRGMLSGWANEAGATTTPTSTTTALASYGQPTQALTDQTNTAPATAVKKPEEQTVRA